MSKLWNKKADNLIKDYSVHALPVECAGFCRLRECVPILCLPFASFPLLSYDFHYPEIFPCNPFLACLIRSHEYNRGELYIQDAHGWTLTCFKTQQSLIKDALGFVPFSIIKFSLIWLECFTAERFSTEFKKSLEDVPPFLKALMVVRLNFKSVPPTAYVICMWSNALYRFLSFPSSFLEAGPFSMPCRHFILWGFCIMYVLRTVFVGVNFTMHS